MSQADIPSFYVDTHVHRLSQRWGLTKGENVIQTEGLKSYFNFRVEQTSFTNH